MRGPLRWAQNRGEAPSLASLDLSPHGGDRFLMPTTAASTTLCFNPARNAPKIEKAPGSPGLSTKADLGRSVFRHDRSTAPIEAIVHPRLDQVDRLSDIIFKWTTGGDVS